MSFTSASSRTESDSGHPGSCDVAAICSETPFSRMLQAAEITNKDFPLFSTGELKGAVTILEMMNTEDLHNDQNLHGRIYQASNTITTFLDTLLLSRMHSEPLIREFPAGLCELLQIDFLAKLFEFRQIFHAIASRELVQEDSAALVVCWVDVILAKLGEAILVSAGNGADPFVGGSYQSDALLKHWNSSALRAALQLPHNWTALTCLIGSEFASPAATRLAVSISFGIYVLCPQLQGGASYPDKGPTPDALLASLKKYVHRVRSNHVGDSDASHFSNEDRTTHAMVITLLANADSATREQRPFSPFRPHTSANILSLIYQVIAVPEKTLSNMELQENLDPAMFILLQWGETVSWCWATWDDSRIIDYEVIEYITATWLYHLGRLCGRAKLDRCHEWEDQLLMSLQKNLAASATVITSMLRSAKTGLYRTLRSSGILSLSPSTLDVISKGSWAASQLLGEGRQRQDLPICQLGKELSCLYVLLPDGTKESEVKDNVLAGLASVQSDVLHAIFADIQEDDIIGLKLRLEDRLTSSTRQLSSSAWRQKLGLVDYHDLRQLLRFLTLIWYSGISSCVHRKSVYSFLNALVNLLSSEPLAGLCSTVLLEPLLTALTILEALSLQADGNEKPWDEEVVWGVSLNALPDNVLLASAFATYVVSTIHHGIRGLYVAQAWDFLRDLVVLVFQRHFAGCDEPLALMVLPTILRAMESLLCHASHQTLRYILASPWTVNLCEVLLGLSRFGAGTDHDDMIRGSLQEPVSLLLTSITNMIQSDRAASSPVQDDGRKWEMMSFQLSVAPSFVLL